MTKVEKETLKVWTEDRYMQLAKLGVSKKDIITMMRAEIQILDFISPETYNNIYLKAIKVMPKVTDDIRIRITDDCITAYATTA